MIPEFQLGDRMALALRNAGHSQQDAADYFGVTRQTISAWTNGRNVPKKGELTLWALWTGVPLSWLQTGQTPDPHGHGISNRGDRLSNPFRVPRAA